VIWSKQNFYAVFVFSTACLRISSHSCRQRLQFFFVCLSVHSVFFTIFSLSLSLSVWVVVFLCLFIFYFPFLFLFVISCVRNVLADRFRLVPNNGVCPFLYAHCIPSFSCSSRIRWPGTHEYCLSTPKRVNSIFGYVKWRMEGGRGGGDKWGS
jgi:hypothetical protein